MTKRKVEIQIEAEQVCIVRHRKSQVAACLKCGEKTVMISMDEAVFSSGLSARHLYHKIEVEEIGFVEQETGLLLICSRCLMKHHPPAKLLSGDSGR